MEKEKYSVLLFLLILLMFIAIGNAVKQTEKQNKQFDFNLKT